MRLDITAVRIEIEAQRSDNPAMLTQIHYRLFLDSKEPREKLEELHQLCIRWGTVTNTLITGITPQGDLVIQSE